MGHPPLVGAEGDSGRIAGGAAPYYSVAEKHGVGIIGGSCDEIIMAIGVRASRMSLV